MTLKKGDVVEVETENPDHLRVSKAEHEGYSILLDERVEEGVHSIEITDVGTRFAFGEILDRGENQ